MGWFKTSNQANITSLTVRLGSDASNYADFTINVGTPTDWQYTRTKATTVAVTGTPDWTATDYAQLRIVQTGDGQVKWNGLRINSDGSFTLFNVEPTPNFDDLRSPQLKPTSLINQLSKTWEYVWYIDYVRDIHFRDKENDAAPFDIDETSNNFTDLSVEVDTSNIGNRVIVRGGEKQSESTYAQVFEGDNTVREWILKNKFKNLSITVDKNTSTDTMEAGTTTTAVNATTHGLSVGDHIVNRTRSNAVREVLTVPDPDSFTVEAVSGQTNGDTFSLFATTKTDGIEGITDETTVDYVANSNEKSVRATASELTLDTAEFIRFEYNERVPIQIQYTDSGSANALAALGLGDGIFDLDPITDSNIEDVNTAISIAEARVAEFGNAVITGTFKTDQKGLLAGQIIHIEDSNRSVNNDYVIQKISAKQKHGTHFDYMEYTVTFGTTLFGWIEFMQKLIRTKDSIQLNVDDIVETYATSNEEVETSEINTVQAGGIKSATQSESVETSETNNIYETIPPWQWETSTGQSVATRWNLFEWGS